MKYGRYDDFLRPNQEVRCRIEKRTGNEKILYILCKERSGIREVKAKTIF